MKAVKNLSQEGYFDKRRNENDERTVLILINDQQREKINALLDRVNETIKSTDIRPQ